MLDNLDALLFGNFVDLLKEDDEGVKAEQGHYWLSVVFDAVD